MSTSSSSSEDKIVPPSAIMLEHHISVENSPKLLKITMIFRNYHENDTTNKDVEDFMAGTPFPFRDYTLPFQKTALHTAKCFLNQSACGGG